MRVISNLIPDEELKAEVQRSIQGLEHQLGRNLLLPNSLQSRIIEHVSNLHKTMKSSPDGIGNETFLDAFILGVDGCAINFTDCFEKQWKSIPIEDTIIEEDIMWTFWNSFFFSFTAITTIGYGHMSPKTSIGQMFCLVYSILGVPFNGIVFAGLADLFSHHFVKTIDSKRYEDKGTIMLDAVFYLIPGIFVFFIVPSVIFMIIEGWTYIGSFYFSFITLSTIGFGDYVAGYPELSSGWLWVYRLFIFAWIVFGLGYLLMIITFIQNALRSKKLRMIDRKMAKLLKKKKIKTSSAIQKDLEKLGSILTTISSLRRKNSEIYNIKEEPLNNGAKTSNEAGSTGNVNPGFEADVEPESAVKRLSLEKELERRESDAHSYKIFMHLAEVVLKQQDTISNTASANDDEMDIKESVSRRASSKKSVSSTSSRNQNVENTRTDTSEEPPAKIPKRPLSRRMSEWTDTAFHSRISKAFHSFSVSSDERKRERTNSDEAQQSSESDIEDLSDLFSKIEGVLSQDVHEERRTDAKTKISRSRSMC